MKKPKSDFRILTDFTYAFMKHVKARMKAGLWGNEEFANQAGIPVARFSELLSGERGVEIDAFEIHLIGVALNVAFLIDSIPMPMVGPVSEKMKNRIMEKHGIPKTAINFKAAFSNEP